METGGKSDGGKSNEKSGEKSVFDICGNERAHDYIARFATMVHGLKLQCLNENAHKRRLTHTV